MYIGRVAHSAGGTEYSSTHVAPVETAVPAGAVVLLVVDAMGNSPFVPITVTDSRSNTWTTAVQQSAPSNIDGQPTIVTCAVTAGLTTSDTITVSASGSVPNRWVVEAHAFDDLDTVVSNAGNPGTFGKSLDSGLAGTASADWLVFAAFTYRYGSFPHTFTPAAGFTGETPLETVGNGVVAEWRYVTASQSLAATMTGSNCTWVGLGAAVSLVAAPVAPDHDGTVSGTFAFVGAAQGTRASSGTSAGTFTFTGTAGGVRLSSGSAAGDLVYTGATSGQAPAVGVNAGTATGTLSWVGVATGTAPAVPEAAGTATGTMLWSGASSGARTSDGIVATILTWVGHAAGKTPGAPGRDITIIGGPITGGWDGKVDGGAWTAHPATGSDWEAATPVGGWTSEEITG